MRDPSFHQEARNPVLHLRHLADQQVSVAQGAAPVSNGGGRHVTFWEEVAAQAVGNLAGINAIILPFGRGDGLGFDPSVGSEGA